MGRSGPATETEYTCLVPEAWTSGEAYDRYMGRWSRLVAAEFVAKLGVWPGASWVDVGCGTGELARAILAYADPSRVEGFDASADYVHTAIALTKNYRASFRQSDARSLPLPAESVDAAVSGLCLNFVPAPGVAVGEMQRVTRGSGVVAAYVWDYANMEMLARFWETAVELDPSPAAMDESTRFPLCEPNALRTLFQGAGLSEVTTWPIEIAMEFRDFDDYWEPFLTGQGPAPGYVAGLAADRREALRERLRERLPARSDGRIALTARAWCVSGRA